MFWERIEDPERAVRLGTEAIGASVRLARLRRGYSQRQLAWRVSMAQSTISRLESGTLRGMRLSRLAMIFGVLEGNPRISTTEPPAAPRRWLPGQRQASEPSPSSTQDPM